jgi:hypothetical protein
MTSFNAPAYDVQRPSGTCAFTGEEIPPGDNYIASLVEYDHEEGGLGLKRVDVSLAQWEKGSRPEQLFCYWRTQMPQPQEKKKLLVDDDVLMNLYRRLEDADQDDRLAFRFVLSLILMRKRLLRYDGTEKRDDGQEWWIMSAKKPDADERELLPVMDPHLDEQRIEQVTEQLSEILEAEL